MADPKSRKTKTTGNGKGRTRPARGPVARTTQLAQKRKRRGRRIRLSLFLGLILAAVLAVAYVTWFRDSSLVEIKHLTVRGLDPADKRDRPVEETVRLAVGQMTTLHPQPDLLERDLKRFPTVVGAELETEFPNRATVTLTMRQDGSRMGAGADEKLIATDGTVLGPAGDRGAGLPRIGSGNPPEDGKLEGPELAQALVLGGTPEKLRPYVKQSQMGDEGVEVELSNGLILGFGEATQIGRKWRAAAAVIADPTLTNAVYVNLTVPRRPAIRTSGPTETTDSEG